MFIVPCYTGDKILMSNYVPMNRTIEKRNVCAYSEILATNQKEIFYICRKIDQNKEYYFS